MINKDNAGGLACIILLLSPLFIILGWIWGGFALSYAWNLLIAPLGLITITTVQAMGIGLVVGNLTKQINWDDNDNDDSEKKLEKVFRGFVATALRPALLMFFAWGLVWVTS